MALNLRRNIEAWANENDISKVPTLAHLVLSLLSFFYELSVRARLYLYSIGIFKSTKLNCKVISIGNITAGGTGKTPMTIYLACKLKEKGIKVVVLSRGYKRRTKGVVVVSDGEKMFLNPTDAGDEPYLIGEKARVPVVVGSNRRESGRVALKKFSPAVIILDDGFQHLKVIKDLNILLIDGQRGFGNGFMLPRGILREPLTGIKRADIVMTKNGRSGLKSLNIPEISFSYKVTGLVSLSGAGNKDIKFLKGKKVVCLSAIAAPEAFVHTVTDLGAEVIKTIDYPDHYSYGPGDVAQIEKIFKESGAHIIVTTEKDGVKLKGLSPLPENLWAVAVETHIDDSGGIFEEKLAELGL